MQSPMFSHSFSYSWILAGGSLFLLGILLLHYGYCPVSPPHVSLFFSGQAVHLITRAGKGAAASFGTQHSPSVIPKSIQSQRSERDSKKKTLQKALARSVTQAAPSQSLPRPLPSPWLPPPLPTTDRDVGQ